MHVAVAGWLAALGPSGARRRTIELLRAAAPRLRAGERITWLGAPPRDGLPGIACHTVAIPPRPTWRRALCEQRVLPALLAELGATVLDLASLPVPRALPCAVCLTIHDLRDLTEHRRRPRPFARAALRRGIARAAHVIVPSRFTAAALRCAVAAPAPPLDIVPNGVDPGFFAPPAAPPPVFPYFLHVGHLERRKNLPLLVHAYARSGAGGTVPRLVLAGADRGAGRSLRRLIRTLGLGDRVQVLGAVGEERLRALYAGATAVLVPSLHEGFGLPLLEGLAAGKPVLASDRGALPEVAGGAALLLPADDVAAWADALRACAHGDVPGLAASRQAHARAFGWDRAAVAILEIWRSIGGPRAA